MKYLPKQEKLVDEQILINKQIEEKKKTDNIKPKLVKKIMEQKELSNSEKIEEIKTNKKYYKSIKLENSSQIYFKENEKKLDLYLDNKKIWNFDLVLPEYLRVELINGSNNDLYIEIWADKFYYNSEIQKSILLDLSIDVDYLKKWLNKNLIIKTSQGSFIYYTKTNSFEYFSFFNDFIEINDWYLWVVNKTEKITLNNLWFETDKSILVYYNPSNKEKTIEYETDLNIKKLYIFNEKVYIVNDKWEKFELENIKK